MIDGEAIADRTGLSAITSPTALSALPPLTLAPLAAAGAAIVVNYASSKEAPRRLSPKSRRDGGRAIAVKGDVRKSAEMQALFDEAKKACGKVDVLVNNAGLYRFDPSENVTEDKFHHLFNTNVLGTLLATREAVKHFGNDGGSVINISSIGGPAFAVTHNTRND